MAFKMTPFHLAQPEASPAGSNYRNPKLVIDRSAEILTKGLQQGVNNFVDSYMEAKKDGSSDKKETPKETPKIDKDKIDEEIKTSTSDSTYIDTSKFNKFNSYTPGQIEESKFDSSTRNSVAVMLEKNGSPNKFLGGIAAAVGSSLGNQASAGGDFDRAKWERLAQKGGVFGKLGRAVLDQNPVADPTQAAQAAASVAPASDMSGDPVLAGAGITNGSMDQTNPFQGKTFKIEPASPATMVDPELASTGIQTETTYNPPTPSNQMGSAKPVFNAAVQASAEAIYGSSAQRQQSVGAAFKKLDPMYNGEPGVQKEDFEQFK